MNMSALFPSLRTLATLVIPALGACSAALAADPYPSKPVNLIVPFPAGGTVDIFGRAMAQALSRQLGQPVVVENKAGAGGTIGATLVVRAQPDGHTLLVGSNADQVNAPFMMAKAPYDAGRDFIPVGCMLRSSNVLVVNAKLPIQNVADLIKAAKAKPGSINFGSAGNGNTSHLSGELFGQVAGVDIVHVPYRGNAPAITDTIGGQVQMLFSNPSSVMGHINSGALRPIAVTSAKRMELLPNVPTLRESGLPIDIHSFACVFAPAKTPDAIVEKLHAAVTKGLDDPDMVKALEAGGAEKFAPSLEESRRFLTGERTTWGNLIKSRNIQAN